MEKKRSTIVYANRKGAGMGTACEMPPPEDVVEVELHDFYAYLNGIESQGFISHQTNTDATAVWKDLQRNTMLPVPNASAGPDGILLLTWDENQHHLEVEFLPEQMPMFFYCDHNVSDYWEVPYDNTSGLLWEKLLSVCGLFHRS